VQDETAKAVERAVVERVVAVRGGILVPSATDPPDCYLRDEAGGPLHPVEVTRAYDAPHREVPEPNRGAPAARAEAKAERMVRSLLANGAPAVISGVHDGRTPYAAPIPPGMRLPLPVAPIDPLPAVIEAIRHKCKKPYRRGTILVIDYQNGWSLSGIQLQAVGKFVTYACPHFREVWIVPEFSNGAQQAPLQ
jgi:hypothetical protein